MRCLIETEPTEGKESHQVSAPGRESTARLGNGFNELLELLSGWQHQFFRLLRKAQDSHGWIFVNRATFNRDIQDVTQ